MKVETETLPVLFKNAQTGLKVAGWPGESEIFTFLPKLKA